MCQRDFLSGAKFQSHESEVDFIQEKTEDLQLWFQMKLRRKADSLFIFFCLGSNWCWFCKSGRRSESQLSLLHEAFYPEGWSSGWLTSVHTSFNRFMSLWSDAATWSHVWRNDTKTAIKKKLRTSRCMKRSSCCHRGVGVFLVAVFNHKCVLSLWKRLADHNLMRRNTLRDHETPERTPAERHELEGASAGVGDTSVTFCHVQLNKLNDVI